MNEETRQDAAVQTEDAKAASPGTSAAGAADTKTADREQESGSAKSYDETYIAKMRADFEKQKADAIEEAVRKEKMSAEEKAKYETEQRERDIAKREQELALRELKADAGGMLAKENLSSGFVDMVVGADAEETQKNVKTLKAAIDAEVQWQVEARLKGTTPRTGSGAGDKGADIDDMEAQINKIMGL